MDKEFFERKYQESLAEHKLHTVRAKGLTLDEMKANIPQDLLRRGDAVLVWVNQGEWQMLKDKGIDVVEIAAALRRIARVTPAPAK